MVCGIYFTKPRVFRLSWCACLMEWDSLESSKKGKPRNNPSGKSAINFPLLLSNVVSVFLLCCREATDLIASHKVLHLFNWWKKLHWGISSYSKWILATSNYALHWVKQHNSKNTFGGKKIWYLICLVSRTCGIGNSYLVLNGFNLTCLQMFNKSQAIKSVIFFQHDQYFKFLFVCFLPEKMKFLFFLIFSIAKWRKS